ncbi:hypothetical protein BU17DRAFT_19878, partial [Hysterangium stoloniferum]
MEEAQAIASEYIQSLDNLPAEVQHHLAEIRDKENRIAEMQARITPKAASYLRHATRGGAQKEKDSQIPDKIAAEHAKMAVLAEEKVHSAERIVQILKRAMGRLDGDLSRAMERGGESMLESSAAATTGIGRTGVNELLKGALGLEGGVVASTGGANGVIATSHPPPKSESRLFFRWSNYTDFRIGRRLNSTAPTASPAGGLEGTHPRSRLSTTHRNCTTSPSSRRATSELNKDADAEGEEDGEDPSGDPEDKTLYCTCQSLSYGKMVGCDNVSCPYQWFHLACVGLQDPLPKHWFCPACVEK